MSDTRLTARLQSRALRPWVAVAGLLITVRAGATVRRLAGAVRSDLQSVERWAFVTPVDWYPDAAGFPTDHASFAPDLAYDDVI